MSLAFADRLRIIRRRILAFLALFMAGGAVGGFVIWKISDAKADPGPIVYLFPLAFVVVLGTFPALSFFLTRWATAFQVRECPACKAFLWPTTIQAVQIALIPRCPSCWTTLSAAE